MDDACLDEIEDQFPTEGKIARLVFAEIAAELEQARRTIDDALAIFRAPDSTNDGGPADLVEEIKTWQHNHRARIAELEADLVTPKHYADGWCAALDWAAGLADEMYERGEEHLIAAAILKMKEQP